jgi:hypothetical protein
VNANAVVLILALALSIGADGSTRDRRVEAVDDGHDVQPAGCCAPGSNSCADTHMGITNGASGGRLEQSFSLQWIVTFQAHAAVVVRRNGNGWFWWSQPADAVQRTCQPALALALPANLLDPQVS